MKKELVLSGLAVFMCLLLLIFGCTRPPFEKLNKMLGLKDDNVFEEALEDMINDQIGIEVDFTPNDSQD